MGTGRGRKWKSAVVVDAREIGGLDWVISSDYIEK